jgi:hypothetical protein
MLTFHDGCKNQLNRTIEDWFSTSACTSARTGNEQAAAKENKLTGYYPIVFFWRFLASLRLNVAVLFLDTSINSSDFSGILS